MSFSRQAAYDAGLLEACSSFGLQKEAFLGQAAKWGGKALNWLGRGASVVPGVGNAAGAVLSGIGGGIQGLAQGEGMKGALTRGTLSAGASLIPGGGGIVAGAAADAAADKLLAPKPPKGPAVGAMPGMIGSGHLPGMVAGT
jgi:hypothetical protein